MLGLPWAIQAMGVGLGCGMLIVAGLGAYWGLYLLTIEGKHVKKGHASFYSLAQAVLARIDFQYLDNNFKLFNNLMK